MLDGPEQEARDAIFMSQLNSEQVQGPFPSRWTCPQVQPWLYGYDAYQVVECEVQKEPFVEAPQKKRNPPTEKIEELRKENKNKEWWLSRLRRLIGL